MSWVYLFRHGYSYVAGFDKPAVVGITRIREEVEEEGFRVLMVRECREGEQLPFRVRGNCGDEWDWIGFVERRGPTRPIDVPDRVQWIVEVPPPQPAIVPAKNGSAPLPQEPPPPPVVTERPTTPEAQGQSFELGRKHLHVGAEALALVAGVPFLWWASTRTSGAARNGLRALAVATAVVDGYLLMRWSRD